MAEKIRKSWRNGSEKGWALCRLVRFLRLPRKITIAVGRRIRKSIKENIDENQKETSDVLRPGLRFAA